MILRTLTSLLFILSLTVFTSPAVAAPLDTAIEAWLADDDKTALPALATLASDGDVDAQVLLGVIATRAHSPYVANLSRKERNRLLRAPGGLSGKSWLKVAAEARDARAAALVAVEAPPFQAAAIATLLEVGEEDSAATALVRAAQYGGIVGVAAIPNFSVPPDMNYAFLRSQFAAGVEVNDLPWPPVDQTDLPWSSNVNFMGAIDLAAFLAFMSRRPDKFPGRDLSLRLFPGDYRDTDAMVAGALLGEIVETSRPAKRLFTYCKAACAEHVQVCVGDTVALLGGYDQIWRLGPPINTLISEDQYLASPRLHADIARQMTTLMKGWSQSRQANWSTKSCSAASRFRTRFP